MNVGLLDVNVLIALLDPAHVHHETAHRWLHANRKHGWASCAITINGCVRILSQPRYPGNRGTAFDVIERLREACRAADHEFWDSRLSLLDERHFQAAAIVSPGDITDAYLLALAVRNHGRLVTFDTTLPIKAVKGAEARHVVTL